MIDDRTEARELMGLMMGDEPPVGIEPAKLVRTGRRRQAITRTAGVGGVAMAVVGVVFFATLARPGPGEEMSAATQAPSVTQVPGAYDPGWHEDDRSRRMTAALQGAQRDFIPAGMQVRAVPYSATTAHAAFTLLTPKDKGYMNMGEGYETTAEVGDAQGFGRVVLHINYKEWGPPKCGEAVDLWYFADIQGSTRVVEPLGCTDQTLQDGTKVRITTSRIRGETGLYQINVSAKRPDGTNISVRSTKSIPGGQDRPAPPLSADDLLKIAALPGLKF